jgi:hypothetical protein
MTEKDFLHLAHRVSMALRSSLFMASLNNDPWLNSGLIATNEDEPVEIWPRTFSTYQFIKTVRVCCSGILRDFEQMIRTHETEILSAATAGFTLLDLPHASPLHAVWGLSNTIHRHVILMDQLDLKHLPLIQSVRLTRAYEVDDDTCLPTKGSRKILIPQREYKSFVGDIVDAWPVELEAGFLLGSGELECASYPYSLLESLARCSNFAEEELRNLAKTELPFVTDDQFICLLNLWMAADEIATHFKSLLSDLSLIDLTELSFAIDRQLASLKLNCLHDSKDDGLDREPSAPDPGRIDISWDAESCTMTVEGKAYRPWRPNARSQMTILNAFEEEGWPPLILDPLPSGKRRDTIRNANEALKRSQCPLRFGAYGDNERIMWWIKR